jgi:phage/plasmid primase-like uncharacterized protein
MSEPANNNLRNITLTDIKNMLSYLDPSVCHHDWFRILAAVHHEFGDAGQDVCNSWSSQSTYNYNEREFISTWKSLKTPLGEPITINTLFYLLRGTGYVCPPGMSSAKTKQIFNKSGVSKSINTTNNTPETNIIKINKIASPEVVETATDILENSPFVADNHPYLIAKQINPEQIKKQRIKMLFDGRIEAPSCSIILPLYNADMQLQGLQFIHPTTNFPKKFLKGSAINGSFGWVDGLKDTIYICEGFATAATINEATGKCAFFSLGVNNLFETTKATRILYPNTNIIIIADNDKHLETEGLKKGESPKPNKNVGIMAAKKISSEFKLPYSFPCFDGERVGKQYTDFNDLKREFGIEKVKEQLLMIAFDNNIDNKKEQELTPSPAWIAFNMTLAKVMLIEGNGEFKFAIAEKNKILTGANNMSDKTNSILMNNLLKNNTFFTGSSTTNTDPKKRKIVYRLDSKEFEQWIMREYNQQTGKILSPTSIKTCVANLMSCATIKCDVFQRVGFTTELLNGETNYKVFIDLADPEDNIIEITESGWKLISNEDCPVVFTRNSNTAPLPVPIEAKASDIYELFNYINILPEDRQLVVAWIIESLLPHSEFPILAINGSQSSGKSTCQKYLKQLIDPGVVNSFGTPTSSQDLEVMAINNYLVSIDNIAGVPSPLQDVLCRIATEGGYGGRKYYTRAEQEVVSARRPIIINGINEFVTNTDLTRRTIKLDLPTLNVESRTAETNLAGNFITAKPKIFGAILTLLGEVIRLTPSVVLPGCLDTLLGFAITGTAIDEILKGENVNSEMSFVEKFNNKQRITKIDSIDHSSIMMAVIRALQCRGTFEGTWMQLFIDIEPYVKNIQDWIKTPKKLSNLVRRHEPGLQEVGIKVERFVKGANGFSYNPSVKISILASSPHKISGFQTGANLGYKTDK